MLNQWSDRDPEPPQSRGWAIAIVALVIIATAAFLLDLGRRLITLF